MRKKELLPFVVVYKDVFPDLDKIFNIVKESETNDSSKFTNEFWEDWSGVATKIKVNKIFRNEEEVEANASDAKDIFQDQLYLRSEMFEKIYECYDDYLNRWIDSPEIEILNRSANEVYGEDESHKIFSKVKNWNFRETIEDDSVEGWIRTTVDFVKYFDSYNRRYILPYHLDNGKTPGTPGPMSILSATLYLNDEYEGGEVSFLNEFDNTIVNYKPKAGDVIVFPGDRPFFHAAFLTSKGNKYFGRHFLTWNDTGSEEYKSNIDKFGEEYTLQMTNSIRKAQDESGLYSKYIYRVGDPIKNMGRDNGQIFFYNETVNIKNDW